MQGGIQHVQLGDTILDPYNKNVDTLSKRSKVIMPVIENKSHYAELNLLGIRLPDEAGEGASFRCGCEERTWSMNWILHDTIGRFMH